MPSRPGWQGACTEDVRLRTVIEDETLRWSPAATGRLIRMVVDIDTENFDEAFLTAVETAQG
ncbi:MAG: hypothetical protein M3417_15260 [Actinomycetota bacterium]|nr:hypothetical protein [Actinomycetota bacterium]